MHKHTSHEHHTSFWRQHRHSYFILAIVGALALGAILLISIKNFSTDEDINSTLLATVCKAGNSPFSCASPHATSSAVVPPPKTAASAPKQPTGGAQTYKNNKYDFQITVTEAWEGYKVQERSIENTPVLVFSLPTTDRPGGYEEYLYIIVFSYDQWNQLLNFQDRPVPLYLAKSDEYVYAYSGGWQNAPKDLVNKNFELQKVMATFKLTQ